MKIIAGLCLFGVLGNACGGSPQDATLSALEPAAGEERTYYRETPSGDYLASQFAQNRQDWKTAEHYLSRVLEHDPDNADLQRRAMILAMGAGETARAIAKARKIIQTDPNNDLALLIVTLDQLTRQKYTDAQVTLKQMQSGSIGELIAPVMIAWAASADGSADFSTLQTMSFHDYHALLIADYLGLKDQLPALAEQIFTDLTLDNYILSKVATTLARNGFEKQAASLYKSLKNEPGINPTAIDEKISALPAAKAASRAIASPEEGAGEALFDMARLMLREGSYESAKIFTRMSLHLYPHFDEARLVLASLLTQDGRYEQAIDYYQSIPKKSPLYVDAQRQAATLLEEEGEGARAITILEQLYQDYEDINALIAIGDIHRNKEQYPDAITAYNRAADALGGKIPQRYWGLLYVRGMAYERAGQYAESERDLKAALTYQPNHPFILNYLGYSWADRGRNLKEAIALLEKAVALEPEDGYIADSLGWALYKAKRYDEALPHLEKAVSLLPYDSEINDHLGDAYWQAGRQSEARFQWERAANNSEDEHVKATLAAKVESGIDAEGNPPVIEAAVQEIPGDETAAPPARQ